ncbi:2OG-Fe(II) oxygenase [Brevundimonas subvibrioides]|uniref:2OG-Fe(II) oxygenase n=1 Tax=Brevundimonas subvibrioides TaxID=74313 RepID=UPI0022B36D01|nr:2OG-Fe(II) oxygenase family protein [Brevundimonas subvibrioides]
MSQPIRLNPGLDARDFASAFQRDGVVQVADFLTPESADRIEAALKTATPWGLSLSNSAGKGEWLSPEALQALGREGVASRAREALKGARTGFAFSYLAYPIIEALLAGREPQHPTHGLVELLNSPEARDFCAAVTGETGITKIDAQATLFRPGDYLTLHDDTGVGERRAAYTIGLTREWRTDWGGQLLFHDAAGDVSRGFRPGFNVLTLFRTPQWHSVATVAPYAGAPRFSITGWLRDDKPYAEL